MDVSQLTALMPPAPVPEMVIPRPPGRPPGKASTQAFRVQMTHAMIIDFMLSNPSATQREIAANFDYTPEGISVIVRSDSFQAAYHKRKEGIVDPVVLQKVEARLDGLAHASIDILQRKLKTSDDGAFALKVLDSAARAAGYGAQKPTALQANFVVNLPGPATSSAEWTSRFAAPGAVILEADSSSAPSES